MPMGLPASTTGTRRTALSLMRRMTSSTDVSGETVSTSLVQMSPSVTCFGSRPSATARRHDVPIGHDAERAVVLDEHVTDALVAHHLGRLRRTGVG